jgi:transposase
VILPGQRLPIVIATRPVDFRRGHDGLAATVQNELGLDPHSGVTVVFRSKRGDRVKILVWDGTGLVLTYKRLETGQFSLAADSRWRDAIVAGAIRSAVRRSRLETRRCAFGAGARCGRLNHPAGLRGHTGADHLRFAHGRRH